MIVINTESTTHINMLYKNLTCLKFILQFVYPITKSNKITHIEYLRTNMKVQTDKVDMLHPQSHIYHFVHIFHTDTKLILSKSGSDICMGMCTYIGIDTKSNICHFSFGSSQFVNNLQLGDRFYVKTENIIIQSKFDLPIGFTHTGMADTDRQIIRLMMEP